MKKVSAYPSIKHTYSPLILAWACTVHKEQGWNLEEGIVDFDPQKEKSFEPEQRYTTHSVGYKWYYCIGELKKYATMHYLHMNAWNKTIYFPQKRNTLLHDTFTILFHNVRSLWKHVDGIISDDRMINKYIIGFR